MTYVRKIFGSGQITLPKQWCKNVSSHLVLIEMQDNKLTITPLSIEDAKYETLFDSADFGYAEGVPVKDFLSALKKVNHE